MEMVVLGAVGPHSSWVGELVVPTPAWAWRLPLQNIPPKPSSPLSLHFRERLPC